MFITLSATAPAQAGSNASMSCQSDSIMYLGGDGVSTQPAGAAVGGRVSQSHALAGDGIVLQHLFSKTCRCILFHADQISMTDR